jgi:hypothetical protein
MADKPKGPASDRVRWSVTWSSGTGSRPSTGLATAMRTRSWDTPSQGPPPASHRSTTWDCQASPRALGPVDSSSSRS